MEFAKISACFLVFINFVAINGSTVKSLTGSWILSDADRDHTNLTATVPGGIYSDLMRNGILEDIFYGDNDVQSRWVGNKSWIYKKQFSVSEELLNSNCINLVFHGLDTFANVFLNGKLIGVSSNMFLRYDFKVKELLKVGANEISVEFTSPIKMAKELAEIQSANYTVFPRCVPNEYNGECHANHVRKMQASFGWDWGPAFPSVGIWKNVYLESYNNTVIKDVTVQIMEEDTMYRFIVTTYFARNDVQKLEGTLIISLFTDIDKVQNMFTLKLAGTEEFEHKQHITVSKQHFTLWWPNGMGGQKLYTMKVTYSSPDNFEQSSKRLRIGIRTVEVIQNTIEKGRNFYFKINGVAMFAKGTNMIPSHILPELSQNETQIRFLLQSSKDVHMNMIRIWGGGLYESDKFYEIADEMGILIWQDFMFACSMYPTNRDFIDTVKEEIQQQVRRLQHHPSIALWAGNNENEAALRGNWYGTAGNFELYKSDYVKLYADTIRPVVLKNDPTRTYLTSSPTNGIESDLEGYVAKNPYDPLYGDVHFYNYIFDSWDQSIYPVPRFASEYGYQSMPSAKSITSATRNLTDLSIYSDFMKHRQHHLGGYEEMLFLIKTRLKISNLSDNFDKAFIFYSQIVQAMAVKIQTEHYRQMYSYVDDLGRGRTMGALYWQLNDVWIAPSWSGIDFKNQWKMQHYFAKDFFAPIIVTPKLATNHNVDIFVVSDLQAPILNATLILSTHNWNNLTAVHTIKKSIDIQTGSEIAYGLWIEPYFRTINCGAENSVLQNCFMTMSVVKNNKEITPTNILLPAPLKDTFIQSAKVQISMVTAIDEKHFSVLVESDAIAAFVWLECDIQGQFSQNGFFQVQPKMEVRFDSSVATTKEEIAAKISVTHLMDVQYI